MTLPNVPIKILLLIRYTNRHHIDSHTVLTQKLLIEPSSLMTIKYHFS